MKYPNTGLYHYCYQLAIAIEKNLNKENEQLTIFTPPNAIEKFNENFNFIKQHSFQKFYLPIPTKYSVWHCTYQGTNYLPSIKKKPIVLTVHDLNFLYDENKSQAKQKKYLDKLKRKVDAASVIVAISNYVLQDLKKHINISGKTTSVIYNGCNINTSVSISTKQLHSKPFLFTIGTIAEKKNFHVLPRLLVKNNFDLVIAGIVQDEAYKQKIIAEAKLYGVENRLFFTNAISEEEKYWYLQNCTAFVFPSIAEGFGLPVVEAMHFGKPLILSKHTSLPEIGGNVSYYFNSFEAEQMQQTLKESLENYFSNNAATKIKERALLFSWKKAAEQYINIYRSLY